MCCACPIAAGDTVRRLYLCLCLYALKKLKAHGLQGQALRDVTLATVVAQLLYASPASNGFIKSEEKAKLQSVLNKTARYGFFSPEWSPKTMTSYLNHQISLFKAALENPDHVIHPLQTDFNDAQFV